MTPARDDRLGCRTLTGRRLYHPVGQPDQHQGDNFRQRLRAAPSAQGLEFLLQRLGLGATNRDRQLLDRRLEVRTDLLRSGAMLHVKREQLAKDVMTFLPARMREQLAAGHDGVGQSAENLGHLDADPAAVLAGAGPLIGAVRK